MVRNDTKIDFWFNSNSEHDSLIRCSFESVSYSKWISESLLIKSDNNLNEIQTEPTKMTGACQLHFHPQRLDVGFLKGLGRFPHLVFSDPSGISTELVKLHGLLWNVYAWPHKFMGRNASGSKTPTIFWELTHVLAYAFHQLFFHIAPVRVILSNIIQ